MDPAAVVFDISSDEDVGWGDAKGVGGGDDDYDWISKLLDEVDRENDDPDEVLLLREVVGPRLKTSSAPAKSVEMDLDDDCVMLDGDPDKAVAIENDAVGESDDLVVVSEKGQVACRDYPHPRHLCANFPFLSSPHERHCDQCHCYVCDTLAPCVHWGTGISSIDHCHATDKDEFWNLQRKCLKNCDKPPLPVPNATDTSLSTRVPQINQVPLSMDLEPNFVPQDQVSLPSSIRACSMSTNFGIPNIINQSRSQRSGYVVPRSRFQPNLVSQQLLRTCNGHRDRRQNAGNLGPQYSSSCVAFKRTGSVGVALTTNPKGTTHQNGYSSANNNYGSHYSRNPPPVAVQSDKNSIRWQDLCGRMTPELSTYQGSSQSNMGSICANSESSQLQVSCQPTVAGAFVNSVPSQPQVSSQQNAGNIFVNLVASRSQVPSQKYVGSVFENSLPSQPLVSSSQPNVGSTFANSAPSQSPVYSQPIPDSNDNQDIFQQGNQIQSGLEPSFTDFDLSWDAPTPSSQSNQQPQADNSQLQGVAPADEPSLVTEANGHFTGSTDTGSLDYQHDSWIPNLENQPASGDRVASIPSAFCVFSPEPTHIDSDIFFEF